MFALQIGTGEISALIGTFLWSFFPIVASLTFGVLSPLQSVALSSLISAGFFAVMLTVRGTWRMPSSACLRDLLICTVLLGIVYYILVFTGLKYTTPGNAGILFLMEIFFSFLTLNLLTRYEPFVPRHVLGATCMVLGVAILLLPKTSGWHSGDLIILAATVVPPLGNVAMQRARREVSAELVMFFRSIVSGIYLLLFCLLFQPFPSVGMMRMTFPALLINGILLFGVSKILWLEAVHRLPITKTISLCSIAPFFTLFFSWLILGEHITRFQLLSLVPIVAGMGLLMGVRNDRNSKNGNSLQSREAMSYEL